MINKTLNIQAAEIIESAATVFMIPGGWCKETSARDQNGRALPSGDPKAVSFCSVGALVSAKAALGHPQAAIEKANKTLTHIMGTHIVSFNDGSPNKTRVIAAFAKASDDLRSRE